MGFVRVVARQLDVFEAVERLVVGSPEVQVLKGGVGLQGTVFFGALQGLEMGLADHSGAAPGTGEVFAGGVLGFSQLGTEGVGTVLAGVLAGDDGGAAGGAGRVGAVGASKQGAGGGESVEVGRANLGIDPAQGISVLLVAGDQQHVGSRVHEIRLGPLSHPFELVQQIADDDLSYINVAVAIDPDTV